MHFTVKSHYVLNPTYFTNLGSNSSDYGEFSDEIVNPDIDDFYDVVASAEKQVTQDPLILAVLDNDINSLIKLSETTELNKFIHPKTGDTLLHIAVSSCRKKAFHYILSISDFPLDQKNNQGDTALSYCLQRRGFAHDHFACELIKKGSSVDSVRLSKNETLLHRAIGNNAVELAKLLMEMGYDVNARNKKGDTPLWMCFNVIHSTKELTEIVTALLYYHADPNLQHSYKKNLFEYALAQKSHTLQEALFHYMIDDHTSMDVQFDTLVVLARRRSPFFRATLEHSKNVIVENNTTCCYDYLLSIDVDDLDALIKKCPDAIREVLPNVRPLLNDKFFRTHFLENLNLLVESDLREDTISFIHHLSHDLEYITFLMEFPVHCSLLLEHLCFLLSYGLALNRSTIEMLYTRFGFGDMLNMLLHMEIEANDMEWHLTDPHLILLFEINFDLKTFLEKSDEYEPECLTELLHYFANAKLQVEALCSNDETAQDVAAVMVNQPTVPLLVELARDAFRKYFVRTFNIKSAGQFYKVVAKLPIPAEHQKIITFDTQLY